MTRKEKRKGLVRQDPFTRDGLHKPMGFGPKALANRKSLPCYGVADRVRTLQALAVGNYGQF